MTLTEEQKKSIDNYGNQIQTLKDFVTSVRKVPGMYIGSLGAPGKLNMIREVFQNSVDQLMDSTSPCNHIFLSYNEQTEECICIDNGKGFPFNDIIRILTKPHTSKNFEKNPYQYSSGRHGIGLKVTNALTVSCIVESYRYDGKAVRMETEHGYTKWKEPKSIPNKEKKQGSIVDFIPDDEIMGDDVLEWKSVYRLAKHIISLTPIGSEIDFEGIDEHGKKFSEHIVNKDGIMTDIIDKVQSPIIKPIAIFEDTGYHRLNCAFDFDGGGENGPDPIPNITAFCNFCPTETSESTHVVGTLDGICRWFTQYMNSIYLANQKSKNKLKVISADIKSCGLSIMIAAADLEPNFIGQSKEILSNPEMKTFCRDTVMKGLDEWAKNNPNDLNKISKFIKEIAEVRQRSESAKTKIVTKYHANVLTGLPSKYRKPTGKKDIELIIVEGESALGTVEEGRDPKTQGLFPIRGKIINAFGASKEKFFSNEEVQGITKIILGTDYKKGFDVKDCKVSKVIFMADADVDGAHISALLLRMFIMYFPQMIKAGMVYKAIPPLYSIKIGKKEKYFTDQMEFVKYNQRNFSQKYTMTTLKGEKLSSKEMNVFFMTNTDYIYYLEKIANTYAVDPFLLEIVLNNYIENNKKLNYNKLKKEVESAYRFMKVNKDKNNIIVEGVIEKSQLIVAGQRFFADCSEILNIMDENKSLYYKIDGKKKSIYNIMLLYNKLSPNGLQRYKGLGEMDADQLAESTLYPGSDRTLVRYTLEDAKEELEAIRDYESNPKKILNLVGNVTRDDLLD